MPVKAPSLFILCHESDQDDCSLRSAFLSDSLQQSLGRLMVPFAFQHADPVQICAAAGCISPAADQRSIGPADHPAFFQCDKGDGRIEPWIRKTQLQMSGIRFVRLPVIGIRFLLSEFLLEGNDFFNICFLKLSDFHHIFPLKSNRTSSILPDDNIPAGRLQL